MRENVVLIGAGSAMFTRGLVADLIRQGWEGELRLVDTDPAALAVAEGLSRKLLTARRSPLRLTAAADRRQALLGATVVICTIAVGGRRAWEKDVQIPRRYGIYQPVGDSVGPGGTSRALRMIPAMVAIARDVQELCPAALFFNYANPMSAVCRGVHRATGANLTGLCHGVFHVAKHLAALLGVEPAQLEYDAMGINHLTWFTAVRADGRDALPRLRQIAREKLAHVPAEWGQHFAEAGPARPEGEAPLDDPLTWELVDLFGAFPAVLDRHVTEFFPAMFLREKSYYGRTLGTEVFSLEKTVAHGDRTYAEMAELAKGSEPLPENYFSRLCGEHEQVIEIIEGIRRGTGRRYSVNLPNQGQAPNLLREAVIEGPAVATQAGLQPILLPPLTAGLAGTLATRFQWAETVVEAALEGSVDKFVQALLLDGAVTSLAQARELARELLAAQAEHLPQFARTDTPSEGRK